MTEPNPIGAIGQILLGTNKNPARHLGWHTFVVRDPQGGNAGRWCREFVKGDWTFEIDFGRVTFYIQDKPDAMFFKLTWSPHLKAA